MRWIQETGVQFVVGVIVGVISAVAWGIRYLRRWDER